MCGAEPPPSRHGARAHRLAGMPRAAELEQSVHTTKHTPPLVLAVGVYTDGSARSVIIVLWFESTVQYEFGQYCVERILTDVLYLVVCMAGLGRFGQVHVTLGTRP